MSRTSYDRRPTVPARSRGSAGWFALLAVAAGVLGYFLFFTAEPDDGTLSGNLGPASTAAPRDPTAPSPVPADG